MTLRDKHIFVFTAQQISAAAQAEADYHRARLAFWQSEYEQSFETVKSTARVEWSEHAVTGGMRHDGYVHYGDADAQARMQEAYSKLHSHRLAAERFDTDAQVYGSQNKRKYELSTDDVHHFHLGGEPREA